MLSGPACFEGGKINGVVNAHAVAPEREGIWNMQQAGSASESSCEPKMANCEPNDQQGSTTVGIPHSAVSQLSHTPCFWLAGGQRKT